MKTSDETTIPSRYPLIEAGITERKLIEHLKELDLYPPIYKIVEKYVGDGKSKPRTGCWMCPKMNIASTRMTYFEFPELWRRLEELEAIGPFKWKGDKSVKEWGERFEREGRIVQTTL